MQQNELYHVGVKGMRWGHRKAEPTSNLKRRYDTAKEQKKAANKEYSRDFNKARNNPLNSFTKKGDQKWTKAVDSAEKANLADAKFKAVKQERKEAIKSKTAELNKNTSFGEKMLFNSNTRKLAAKYIVDKNMTVEEATKKSHAVAIRNTAAFMAVYGAYMYTALKITG